MTHKTANSTSTQPMSSPMLVPEAHGYGGPACVLLLLRTYDLIPSGIPITVKHLRAIRLGYTTAHELVSLAADFELALTSACIQHVADLRQYLYSERPVILLVNYGDFIIHPGSGRGTRWVFVSNYDDNEFAVHDPLWAEGTSMMIPASTLQAALVKDAGQNAVV